MPTIAELEIKVDSTQTEKGTKALLALAEAADKAAAARKRLNDTAGGGGGGPGGGGSDDASTKKAKSLSEAIDAQAKKLADLARQRKALNDSPLKTENPEEYKRLNAVIDARTELVRRQGNSLDALAAKAKKEQEQREAASRASQAAADKEKKALEQREAAAARFAEAEQKRLSITISSLSRQVKAQEDYNRTVATLNNARAVGGMSGGSGGISGAQYDTYIKQAAAIRDAALAQADNTKEIERAQRAYDASVASLGRVERAEATYAKNLRDSDAALKLNLITQEQYTRQLAAFAAKRDASISQANSTAVAEARLAEQLKSVLSVYDPVARATDSYNNSLKILSAGLQSGQLTIQQFNKALTEQRTALDNVKSSQPNSSDSQARQYQSALDRLLPYNAQLRSLNEIERTLQQTKAAGKVVSEQQIKDYNAATAAIAAERVEIERRSSALTRSGNSAKQDAAALRGLPAQFTDIVVSLQGGQAPLTVLLQQGGQIKDIFGGVVPAFKAVGGAVLALITPLSVIGATLALVGVAALQGASEITEFNKATAKSAGFSGLTTDAFLKMRDSIDGVIGTSRDAAAALTALQASGKVSADQFEKIAVAAISFSRVTGQSVQSVVDDFASLAKDPVSAVVTLDEKYKFLTASVLAQVDSLQRQGDVLGAVTLAQSEMAAGVKTLAIRVEENLGYVEKSWRKVKDTALEAWDAVLGAGRQQSSTDQLKQLQEALVQLETRGGSVTPTGQGVSTKTYVGDDGAKELKERIGFLKQSIDFTNKEKEAKAAAKRAEEVTRQAGVTATSFLTTTRNTTEDPVDRAQRTLDLVKKKQEQVILAAQADSKELTAQQTELYAQALAGAQRGLDSAIESRKNKNKPKTAPVDNTQVQEVKNNLDSIKSEYSNYYKQVTALGEANIVSRAATYASQKSILEAEAKAVDDSYEQQIAAIKRLQGNKSNSAQANISLNNQLNKAESDRTKAAEEAASKQEVLDTKEKGRIDARTASIEAYNDALRQQIENTAVSGERQAAAVGKGDRQGKVDDALAENDRSYAKGQLALEKQFKTMDPEEYAAKLKGLSEAHTAMADQIVANDARIQEANADWTNGFTKAIQNAADEGNNFADSVNRAVSGAFDSMGDALGTFVTTGKLSFSDLTASILSDMAKIAAKQAASSALSSLFGLASTAASAYFGGGTTSGFGATAGAALTAQAKGGAWDGGTKFFAQGGAFTNSIVSDPTAFGMSGGGTGIMGEAGPEAIVPLARSSDGSLGVRLVGSGTGSSGASVNVYVTVTSDGTSSSSDSTAYEGFGSELAAFVDTKVNAILNKELKDGGQINRAIKG